MATAYSYIRWSSAKQSEGDSERRQLDAADKYAAEHGLTISPMTFRDSGVSAFKGKNAVEGELGAFIAAVNEGKIAKGSYLLIENFDRLSRAPVNTALRLFQDIIESGIVIVTLTDGQIYSTARINENWTSLIIALSVMARAHEEQKRKGDMVKKAWDAKRELQVKEKKIASKNGPSWLTLSEDRKTWIVNQEKADIVRRIFHMAAEDGHGSNKISIILNTEGVPTIGKSKPNKAEDWATNMVSQLLKQETVFGRFKQYGGGAVVDDYYPAIVTKKLFDAVQVGRAGRMHKGGQKQGVANIFSGLCVCAYCQKKMKFVRSGTKTKIPYLMCLSKVEGTGCTAPMMPYLPTVTGIFDRLINRQLRDLSPTRIQREAASIVQDLEQKLISKQAELEQLVKIAMLAPNVVVIADKLEVAQEEMDALQAALVKARSTPITDQELEANGELFKQITSDITPELTLKVQVALRRQVSKVELAAHCERYANWIEGVPIDRDIPPAQYRGPSGKYEYSESPTHVAIIHYAGGSIRTVDITPFYNASIEANKPKTRVRRKLIA
jgi:DNA invertase Pin-like site-specific DNA recombinase